MPGAIASLQMSPQGVVRSFYPLKGNEIAMGHNLFKGEHLQPPGQQGCRRTIGPDCALVGAPWWACKGVVRIGATCLQVCKHVQAAGIEAKQAVSISKYICL